MAARGRGIRAGQAGVVAECSGRLAWPRVCDACPYMVSFKQRPQVSGAVLKARA